MNNTLDAARPKIRRILPCQVGGARYGFDLDRIHSIRGRDRLQINPSGDGPVGWLLDDEELAVFDLAERLHLPLSSVGGRVIVLHGRSGPFCLLVDRVQRGFEVSDRDIQRLPGFLGPEVHRLVHGALEHQERPMLLLDPEGLEPGARLATGRSSQAPANGSGPLPIEPRTDPSAEQPAGRLVLFDTRLTASFDRPMTYGLSIRQVVELVDMPSVAPIPGAPPFVRGLVIWRDRPLLVVDLDRRFEWTTRLETLEERLLVVWSGTGQPIGLPARSNVHLRSLPLEHRVVKIGPDRPGDPALGLFELERSTLVIPDLSLFADDLHDAHAGPTTHVR